MAALVDRGPAGPPAHLYVHVPFCLDRCTYCAFATVHDDPSQHRALVDALIVEHTGGPTLAPLRTIYVGGGTPSRLARDELARLLAAVVARTPPAPDAEITLEVNPGDVTGDSLKAWHDLGVTRLSMGVQTFETAVLRRLGRHHTGDDARRALDLLGSWQGTWSADLLVGWAGQTLETVVSDVSALLEAQPPHVSVYGLTLEPGTSLAAADARGEVVTAPPELSPSFDDRWSAMLTSAGYDRYEISNFSLTGHQSNHNQAYWRNDDVIGLGPGAVSTHADLRWRNDPATKRFVQRAREGRSMRVSCERVEAGSKLLETLAVGLRTLRGVDTQALDRRFSGWRELLSETIAACIERGWWVLEPHALRVPEEHRVRVDRLMDEVALSLSGEDNDPFN